MLKDFIVIENLKIVLKKEEYIQKQYGLLYYNVL